ncbi:MAG: SGNH/GDSL hydrolase family protein [Cytophagales bacterium]|nr:MAG: SGNH/GDSL hydrolase family protein [Cytophagales bacterium]
MKESIKILALGDSYTIGENVEKNLCFPKQVAKLLQKENKNIEELKIVARTGWRTDNLKDAINLQNLKTNYDLVFLLIGVNNQYQNKNTEIYEYEFSNLVDSCISFAKNEENHVFVISIPDYGYTPFGDKNKLNISEEINFYNAINFKISKQKNVNYINITDISKSSKPNLLSTDNLHPSAFQYGLWAELIFEKILKAYS